MNKVKDLVYKYRILVTIVCIILICGCGYAIYSSFSGDDSYVTTPKNGDKAVAETEDITISKDDLYEYFLDYEECIL